MASDLVKALWQGTPQTFVDGTPLIAGETVCEIPAGQAEASADWKPLERVDPLKGLDKDQLVALAAEREIDLGDATKVSDIRKAILAHLNAKGDD